MAYFPPQRAFGTLIEVAVLPTFNVPTGLAVWVPTFDLGITRPAGQYEIRQANTVWRVNGRPQLGLAIVHFELIYLNNGASATFTAEGVVGDNLNDAGEIRYASETIPTALTGAVDIGYFAATIGIQFIDPLTRLDFGVELSHDAGTDRSVTILHALAWYEQLDRL